MLTIVSNAMACSVTDLSECVEGRLIKSPCWHSRSGETRRKNDGLCRAVAMTSLISYKSLHLEFWFPRHKVSAALAS
jgi:hypothetical protein